jgi:hypothetical protein
MDGGRETEKSCMVKIASCKTPHEPICMKPAETRLSAKAAIFRQPPTTVKQWVCCRRAHPRQVVCPDSRSHATMLLTAKVITNPSIFFASNFKR